MTVAQQVRIMAAAHPANRAIEGQGHPLSYEELWASVSMLATVLNERGVRPYDVVAVVGSRGRSWIQTMLAVMVSGGIVLPIDLTMPDARRRLMLAESGARYLVDLTDAPEPVEPHHVHALPTRSRDPGTFPRGNSQSPAYIFFTSGSSGSPKGVLGNHAGLAHFVDWQRTTFDIAPGDRVAHLTTLSFDVVLREVFVTLTAGACLIMPDSTDLSGDYVLPWLKGTNTSVVHTVPTLARRWLQSEWSGHLASLRLAFFAGEPLDDRLAGAWRAVCTPGCGIVNLYGPTETTLAKCYFVVPDPPRVGIQPLGHPLPQTQVFAVGPAGTLLSADQAGELVIRTPFRTNGYLSESAGSSPFRSSHLSDDPEDVLYFTGDRGRIGADGEIHILGRLDLQVKVRGVRVDPLEAERILAQHPDVEEAVLCPESSTGETELRAFIKSQGPLDPIIPELRKALLERLPAAALPASFIRVGEMPLTASGKVDRQALISSISGVPDEQRAAPGDWEHDTERRLAAVWRRVLDSPHVGRSDDFFDLGGDSLDAMSLTAQIEREFGVTCPIDILYDRPTIAALAAFLDDLGAKGGGHTD